MPELNVTSSVLTAISRHLGEACSNSNKAYARPAPPLPPPPGIEINPILSVPSPIHAAVRGHPTIRRAVAIRRHPTIGTDVGRAVSKVVGTFAQVFEPWEAEAVASPGWLRPRPRGWAICRALYQHTLDHVATRDRPELVRDRTGPGRCPEDPAAGDQTEEPGDLWKEAPWHP